MKLSSKPWSLPKGIVAAAFAAALAFTAGRAGAQSYVTYGTTFDGFQSPASLSGQDGWDTTDLNQADYVGYIGNYSASFTDYWAGIGGQSLPTVTPGSTANYLFRPFGLGTSTNYAFNVDFGVTTSAAAAPNEDRFGWTFQDSGGNNIFSLNFIPSATTAGVDAARYQIGTGAIVSSGQGIVLNSKYHLTVSVNITANTFSASLTPLAGGTTVALANGVSLTGVNAGAVSQIAATWLLRDNSTANGGNGVVQAPGTNEMYFNNYIVTIPEPSTWAMLSVGFGLAVIVIRRRTRV